MKCRERERFKTTFTLGQLIYLIFKKKKSSVPLQNASDTLNNLLRSVMLKSRNVAWGHRTGFIISQTGENKIDKYLWKDAGLSWLGHPHMKMQEIHH